jgi:hypothetical protein
MPQNKTTTFSGRNNQIEYQEDAHRKPEPMKYNKTSKDVAKLNQLWIIHRKISFVQEVVKLWGKRLGY